jgi:uncharacterized membrane protein YozB (DUF420 family)
MSDAAVTPFPVRDDGAESPVDDPYFWNELQRLRELRAFLTQEAVPMVAKDGTAISLGILNRLRFDERRGRSPTAQEWTDVERLTQTLFGLLPDGLRRKFAMGAIPKSITLMPIVFIGVALAALLVGVIFVWRRFDGVPHETVQALSAPFIMPFYLMWLCSLGAIGAIAFVGMNALSVQQDITFDLTNKKLTMLRIALGSLFALVITLPFGFDGFRQFILFFAGLGANPIGAGGGSNGSFQLSSITAQALMMLLPFALGFSTTLVITILSRAVDAGQALFGGRTATGADGPSRGGRA